MGRINLAEMFAGEIAEFAANMPAIARANNVNLTSAARVMRGATNAYFPFVGFTHGGSYTVGNMASSINVNSFMVGHSHMDQYHDPNSVISAVTRMGKDIWIKSLGGVGYDNMKAQLMLFKNSPIANRVVGFIHSDECNRDSVDPVYVSVSTLLQQQQAWREVFPGKPDVLNLLPNNSMNTYAASVMPKILAVDAYLNTTTSCGYVNDYTTVAWACNKTLQAYNAAGMTVAGGYCLGFYFQIFQQQRCAAELLAHGVPAYGDAMFDTYFQTVLNWFGNKWGWAAGYAWKDDDAFDGFFPQDHSDLWPSIEHLSNLIYGQNMATPWNVTTLPDDQPSAVSITSFSSNRNYVSPAKPDTTLTWATTGAQTLEIDNGIGVVTGTSKVVSPTMTTTYQLKATASNGDVAYAYVTITYDDGMGGGVLLDCPVSLYCNKAIHVGVINGGGAIAKVAAYKTEPTGYKSAGVCVKDGDGAGFTFTPNSLTGNNFIFDVTFSVVDSGVEAYSQAFELYPAPTVDKLSLNLLVGQSETITIVAKAGEHIESASPTNNSVLAVVGSYSTAVATGRAVGTTTAIIYPTLLPGYNSADFKITIPVTVTSNAPAVNYVYGQAVILIADGGVAEIPVTGTPTPPPPDPPPPPVPSSNLRIAIWCYQDFEDDLLAPSSTVLADLGVNAIIFEMLSPNRTLTQVLDKIKAKGIVGYGLCTRGGPDIEELSIGDQSAYATMADEVKTHSAFAGYIISDEADKTGSGGAAGDAARKANYASLVSTINSHDSSHPTVNVSTARWASISGVSATERAYSAAFLAYGDDTLMYGNFPERETATVIATRNSEAMTKFGGKLGLFLPTWRDAAGVTYPMPTAQNMVDAAMGAKTFGTRFELLAMWGWKDFNSPKMWSTIGDNATIYSNVKTAIAQIRAIW